MCGTTSYATSPLTGGGTWSSSNNTVTFNGGASNNSSVLVQSNPNTPYTSTILSYTYTPTGCPPITVSKTISTSNIGANVFVSRNWYWFKENFSLWASPIIPGATYSWKVWYGFTSNNLNYYTASGPYITTPKMWHYGIFPYYLKWELTITTSCGSKKLTGIKNNMSYLVPLMAKPETFMETDSSAFYLETRFTEADSVKYEQTVTNIIASKFVVNPTDTFAIAEMIGRIRMEALEPYLYFGDKDSIRTIMAKANINNTTIATDVSIVYPNPASQTISIRLSNKFNHDEKIRYKMFDLVGKVVKENILDGDIDISGLANGTYIIELYQTIHSEHCKFLKK